MLVSACLLRIASRVNEQHCLHSVFCLQAVAVCLTDLLLSSTLFPSKSGNSGVVSAFCAFGLREVAMADLHAQTLCITCHLLDSGRVRLPSSVLFFGKKFWSSLVDLAKQRRQRHLQTVLFQYKRIHEVLMQR